MEYGVVARTLLFLCSVHSRTILASWNNSTEWPQEEDSDVTVPQPLNDTALEPNDETQVFVNRTEDDTPQFMSEAAFAKLVQYNDLVFDKVDVRLYSPMGGAASDAGVVYMHGGGWASGDKESLHDYLIDWTNRTSIPFLSIYYRLAPDNPYPNAFSDSLKAVKYFITHAPQWRINPERIALMGDAAGGNLAAAVCLHLRDEGFEPQPVEQLLLYPSAQAIDFNSPSFRKIDPSQRESAIQHIIQYALGHLNGDVLPVYEAALANEHTSPDIKQRMASTTLTLDAIPTSTYPENYTIPHNRDGNRDIWQRISPIFLDPYFMPLMSGNFSSLPDAFILVGSEDPLLDDALWLKEALLSGGGKVNFVMVPGGHHGILSMPDYREHPEYWEKVTTYVEAKLVSGTPGLPAAVASILLPLILTLASLAANSPRI